MRKVLIASGTLIAIAAAVPALAGDLEPVVTPDLFTAPPAFSTFSRTHYNWTGTYVGINAGGSFGHVDWSSVPDVVTGSSRASSGLVGVTIGYNLQTGAPWVLGAEADLDWFGLKTTVPLASCVPTCDVSNPWIITTRARVGYAFDNILPYVTGGAAFGDLVANTVGAPFGRQYANNFGWSAGLGVEVVIWAALRAKLEYLHVDLGSVTCNQACGGGPIKFGVSADIVRAGLNYRIWTN